MATSNDSGGSGNGSCSKSGGGSSVDGGSGEDKGSDNGSNGGSDGGGGSNSNNDSDVDVGNVGGGGGSGGGEEDDNGGNVNGMDQKAKKEEEGVVARTTTADKRWERTRGKGVDATTSRQTRKRRRRQQQEGQQGTRGRRGRDAPDPPRPREGQIDNNQLLMGAAKARDGGTTATTMDGATATAMDGTIAKQWQQQWMVQRQRDDNKRHNGDAMATTVMAMEGMMTTMDGTTVTATVTVAKDNEMAIAMEGTALTQEQRQRWKV
jgi:hypothetical protein